MSQDAEKKETKRLTDLFNRIWDTTVKITNRDCISRE